MAYEKEFAAMADPTRQAILLQLRSGPKNVARLAKGFSISRPAISQHLKVLNDAGLVHIQAEGTRRFYRINAARLNALRTWMDTAWDDALAAYSQAAHTLAKEIDRDD